MDGPAVAGIGCKDLQVSTGGNIRLQRDHQCLLSLRLQDVHAQQLMGAAVHCTQVLGVLAAGGQVGVHGDGVAIRFCSDVLLAHGVVAEGGDVEGGVPLTVLLEHMGQEQNG